MLELRAGSAVAVVDPEGGGRLTRLHAGDAELLAPDGCFVMAPWAGRTGGGRFTWEGVEHHLPVAEQHAPHAIHGTVRHRRWEVLDATTAAVRLAVDLGPDWPWPGRCEQHIALADDSIRLELSVHADGPAFPAVVGWHPWFAKPEAVELRAEHLREKGPDRLPTGRLVAPPAPGERPLDDCFTGIEWPVVLHGGGLTVWVGAEGCDEVVVYDEPAHATCVEPQTGPPNALATGEAAVVEPGAPLVAATTWWWTPTVDL